MAYGPAKTGKSSTLFGDDARRGLLHLFVQKYFEKDNVDMKVSMVEMYGQNMRDVFNLGNKGKGQDLDEILHHAELGCEVMNLTRISISSYAHFCIVRRFFSH